jgi:predicted DNA repair protein MutK
MLTKVAAKKTAGVLGDDLALNAQQVAGVRADRELPVVWAVAKGSLLNKAILVPAALAISAFAPWLITPLLMLGGAFLCFEGVEKLATSSCTRRGRSRRTRRAGPAVADRRSTWCLREGQDQGRGAHRLHPVGRDHRDHAGHGGRQAPLGTQVGVLVGIALVMTIGVYGLVAGIVKLDDAGLWLTGARHAARRALGRGLLVALARG